MAKRHPSSLRRNSYWRKPLYRHYCAPQPRVFLPQIFQELLFDSLASLPVGQTAAYEIFVKALNAGDQRLHVELTADQLESGPVIEEESTRVFSDSR